jgi:hypothetical protein
MPAAASDVRLDADSSSHRPYLPPTASEEAVKRPPPDSDEADKDEDVVVDVVAVPLVLLRDVEPPSQRSQQGKRQGTWRHRPWEAEDIMHHHPRRNMSRPLRTRTSRRDMQIGMHVIRVVSTYRTDIQVKHALHIQGSRIMTSTSPGRMHSSTSIKGTTAQLKTATRRFSRRCDG